MAGDISYESTSIAIHGRGGNNSTTFIDTSIKPKALVGVGGAKIITAEADPFGVSNGVIALNGAGDYLQTPDNFDFAFGSGSFTIETFIKFKGFTQNNTTNSFCTIVCKDATGNREFSFMLDGTTTSLVTLRFQGWHSSGVAQVTANYSFSLNIWYHLAVVRSGNLIYFFVNGGLINPGGTAFSFTILSLTAPVKIGATDLDSTSKFYLNGLICDLRITKGVARYTVPFSVPNEPFANGYSQISGVITESLAASKFIARAYDMDTGVEVGNKTTTTNAFTLDIKTAAKACEVKVSPDYKIWKPSTAYAVGDNVFPRDPIAKPYYYKRLAAGNSGASEPAWVTSPPGVQINDGAQTNAWELVERLIQPITHGPLIPS